jgi:hypothetical protein
MRSIIGCACSSIALITLVLIGYGCGDGPALVPASGNVTLDGEPLEGAIVTFVPVVGNAVSTTGTDSTGPKGNFQMSYNGRAGLAPGKYKVMISKTEDVSSKDGRTLPPEFAKASFEKGIMGLTKETIPPQKFEQEVEVVAEGVKDFALDFKSESKTGKK